MGLIVLLAVILLLVCGVFALWHNEIFTVMSFEQIRERNDEHLDGAVYTMDYAGDYYIQDFIDQGGVKSDAELIAFVTQKITKGIIPMDIEEPQIGCSSFIATAQNGDALFARNYDFSKTNTCIVTTKAMDGRHATVSSVNLQFLGIDNDRGASSIMDKITCLAAVYAPLDGVNDAGVSCGIYMTYQGGEQTVATDQNTNLPDITSTTLLRLILDYAGSVDEAVEIAKSYDLHDSAGTSYHYMVADSTGKSVVLEWVAQNDATDNNGAARQLVVTYNTKDENIGQTEGEMDCQWVTNFVLQPGYYDGVPQEEKKGYDRYLALQDALVFCKGVVADEQAAMDILSIVGRRTWQNDDNNGCTVHSAVYNLTQKSMLWVPNENYTDSSAKICYTLQDGRFVRQQ